MSHSEHEFCVECGGPIRSSVLVPIRVQLDGRWITADMHAPQEKPQCWEAFDARGRVLAGDDA